MSCIIDSEFISLSKQGLKLDEEFDYWYRPSLHVQTRNYRDLLFFVQEISILEVGKTMTNLTQFHYDVSKF